VGGLEGVEGVLELEGDDHLVHQGAAQAGHLDPAPGAPLGAGGKDLGGLTGGGGPDPDDGFLAGGEVLNGHLQRDGLDVVAGEGVDALVAIGVVEERPQRPEVEDGGDVGVEPLLPLAGERLAAAPKAWTAVRASDS
jgi:hypothetical protein